MEQEIDSIISGDEERAAEALKKFVELSSEVFAFPYLNTFKKRQSLWDSLYKLAKSSEDSSVLTNCFAAIRILSREKISLNELVSEEWFSLIKTHSGLDDDTFTFNESQKSVAIEVLKSLCNVIYNSKVAAAMCSKNEVLEKLMTRIRRFKQNVPEEVSFFDIKLLFLITALCSETRVKVADDMNGIEALIQVLDVVWKDAASDSVPNKIMLKDDKVDLVCEALKALFNLTLNSYGASDDETEQCARLVVILRMYILIPTSNEVKNNMLKNNTVNLLTNVPLLYYKLLYTAVQPGQKISKKFQFEGQNMTVFYEILMFLKSKFVVEPTVSAQHEVLSPVILLLFKCASSDRAIRKYLRFQILPPLKDVHNRPEQGTTLRNCLCRLLTTPITQLRDMVAEFLFVLCKKNVNRMVKYTGYGNAAGLFAQRGLLGGKSDEEATEFSSDNEDSETEEYAEFKHGINPVTGCYEAPHPSPMENMTEEQKEYEAMRLVELMANLTKCGAIKPCRVGPDGKPQPIEHVLQLQEGLRSQQINKNDSDSDD